MNIIVAIPIIALGAAGIWWLSKHTPKGVLIGIGILLNIGGRYLSSQFHMVYGINGERIGSLSQRLLSDLALPFQLLGVIAVIHGIIILFKRKKVKERPVPSNPSGSVS